MCENEKAPSGIVKVGVALRIADMIESCRESEPTVAPVTAYRVAWLTPLSSAR